jgi:uncharacterized membrane protein
MPWTNQKKNDAVERAVAGLCYLSMGLTGLLYIIITGKRDQSHFFRFHFLQSILLCVFGFFLSFTGSILQNILGGMLGLVNGEMAAVVRNGIGTVELILMGISYLLCLYGLIFAFLGKYAEIPVVSKVVKQQLR